MEVAVEHPVEGHDPRARHPGEALRHAGGDPAAGPLLGQHTEEIRQAGFDAAEIEVVTEVRFDRRGPPRGDVQPPRVHNAMTFAMYERLHDACETRRRRRGQACSLLRGAGEKAFVAPTSASSPTSTTPARTRSPTRRPSTASSAGWRRCASRRWRWSTATPWAPGFALSAACDLRVCTPAARFGPRSPARSATACRWRTTRGLAALLGPARLKDIVFTARTIEPEEVGYRPRRGGRAERAEARVEELCELLASHAPVTLWATKEALRRIRARRRLDGEDLIRAAYGSRACRNVAAFRRDPSSAERDRGGRGRTGARMDGHGPEPDFAVAARSRIESRNRERERRAARRDRRERILLWPLAPARPAGGRRRRGRRGAGVRGRRPLGLVDHVGDPARPRRLRRPRALTVWLARHRGRVEPFAWAAITLVAEVALLFWVGFVALGYGPE